MTLKKILKGLPLLIVIVFLVTVAVNFYDNIKVSVYPAFKTIEQQRILSSIRDYNTLETERFIIRYPEGEKEAAELTAEIAERRHDQVTSLFNYETDKKHTIIVYNDGEKLMRSVRLNKSRPPMGVYYSGIIGVLAPDLWISDKENMAEIFDINGPIAHEFAHLIVDDITNGNYPMWLTEGVALYTDYVVTGYEWGKNLNYNEEIPMEVLNNNFHSIDQTLAYKKSFEIVRDISETMGFEKVIMLLNTLGSGNNINNSVEAVLKMNLNDMQNIR